MKISSRSLANALKLATRLTKSNSVMPVTESILARNENGTLTINATNLETSLILNISTGSQTEAEFCVPAETLFKTANSLDGMLDISTSKDKLTIETEKGKYSLGLNDIDEFPLIEGIQGEEIVLPDNFIEKLSKALQFVSKDELRPSMSGVHIKLENSYLTIESTDAHRLFKSEFETDIDKELDVIIPAGAVSLIIGTFVKGEVVMKIGDSNISFSQPDKEIVTRTVEGIYPNVNAVIPQPDKKFEVSKSELESSLKRLGIFANRDTLLSVFKFDKDTLEITSQNLDYNRKAKEVISCKVDYLKEFRIGFNTSLLLSILKQTEDDKVVMGMTEPNIAMVIKEGNDLYLTMPVNID